MLDAETIFRRYETIRPRLPAMAAAPRTAAIATILDIAEEVDAFVFDAFGVLNLGESLIAGADHRLRDLRARNCKIRVLTNAASYGREAVIAKFGRLGLGLDGEEIVTSREAALKALPGGILGVIAADGDGLEDVRTPFLRLGDAVEAYDAADALLFLSSAHWTDARQRMLMSSMARHARPVIVANADLAAPREQGFTLEPGHYGHLIADAFPGCVRFFGKPFEAVYHLVERTLPSVARDRIAMCGDTLHTDILGAAAFGWRTVLVTGDGLLAGLDASAFCVQSGIHADWQVRRI
jgi:HAD superfamily hydrolase (TIGR01450 family)